jgi:hypothetical protein
VQLLNALLYALFEVFAGDRVAGHRGR